MSIEKIHPSGVCLVSPDKMFKDHRGLFLETYRHNAIVDQESDIYKMFEVAGVWPYTAIDSFRDKPIEGEGLDSQTGFLQGCLSISAPFVLRGMHYAVHGFQAKLVRCVAGNIYQVSVDIRKDSLTFGQWVGVHLDAISNKAVFVPPGFANGFTALQNGATVHYEMTQEYDESLDRSLAWNDPDIGIKWPFGPNASVILSAKDRAAPRLAGIEPWTP